MPGSKRDDQFTIAKVRRTRCHDQTSVWCASGSLYASFDFFFVARVDGSHFKALRGSHGLDNGELTNRGMYCEIAKHGHARGAWCDLPKQFWPLSGQAVFELQKTWCYHPGGKDFRQTRTRLDLGHLQTQSGCFG